MQPRPPHESKKHNLDLTKNHRFSAPRDVADQIKHVVTLHSLGMASRILSRDLKFMRHNSEPCDQLHATASFC